MWMTSLDRASSTHIHVLVRTDQVLLILILVLVQRLEFLSSSVLMWRSLLSEPAVNSLLVIGPPFSYQSIALDRTDYYHVSAMLISDSIDFYLRLP